jgi:hypothetical protein
MARAVSFRAILAPWVLLAWPREAGTMNRPDADETWTIDLVLVALIVVAVVWARLFVLV